MVNATKWPKPGQAWSWMRCRTSKRAKWRVLLVEVITYDERQYVRPFQERDCLSRAICEGWETQFVPATPPPADWQ